MNNPKQIDHILDYRFYRRRRVLQAAKCTIGELSRKIETEWHIADFGKVDKTGIQLLADIKQVCIRDVSGKRYYFFGSVIQSYNNIYVFKMQIVFFSSMKV